MIFRSTYRLSKVTNPTYLFNNRSIYQTIQYHKNVSSINLYFYQNILGVAKRYIVFKKGIQLALRFPNVKVVFGTVAFEDK